MSERSDRWWWERKVDFVLWASRALQGISNACFRLKYWLHHRWLLKGAPDPDIPRLFPLWPPAYR